MEANADVFCQRWPLVGAGFELTCWSGRSSCAVHFALLGFFSVFGLCLRVWMRGRFVRDAYLEAEGGEHGVSQRPTRCNVHRTTGADVFLRGPEILQEDHHCEMPSHGIVPALVNPLRCVHHPTTTSRHEDSCTTTFWRSRHRLILVNRTSVRGATWQVVGKRDEFAFLATERCSWTRVSFKL